MATRVTGSMRESWQRCYAPTNSSPCTTESMEYAPLRSLAQLSDDHQGCHPLNESDQSTVPKLGHSLCGHKRLRSTSSRRVAGQDCGTRSSDSSRTVVPATRWSATGAPPSPTRTPAGEPPACGGAVTSPDSFHRSDSLGLAGGTATNTTPLSYQAPALGLQRFRRGDSR